jgi:hypothetical protein
MGHELRDHRVSVAISKADREAIERTCARMGITPSEFMRSAALTMCALRGNPHALLMILQGIKNTVTEVEAAKLPIYVGPGESGTRR